jgi:hypothetical protein
MRKVGAGLMIAAVIFLATALAGWSWAGIRQSPPADRQAGWFWDGASSSPDGIDSQLIDTQS